MPSSRKSDTEVLLQLFIRKGERVLEELDGMFALLFMTGKKKPCLRREITLELSRCSCVEGKTK